MGNKHTRSFPSTPVVAKALPPFAPATEPHNSTHLRSRVELKLPHERTLRGCSPNGIGGDGDRGTLATEGGARDAGVNVAPPPGIVRVVHQHPMPGRVTDPSVLVVLNPPTPGRRQLPTRSVRMYAKGPLKTQRRWGRMPSSSAWWRFPGIHHCRSSPHSTGAAGTS